MSLPETKTSNLRLVNKKFVCVCGEPQDLVRSKVLKNLKINLAKQ